MFKIDSASIPCYVIDPVGARKGACAVFQYQCKKLLQQNNL